MPRPSRADEAGAIFPRIDSNSPSLCHPAALSSEWRIASRLNFGLEWQEMSTFVRASKRSFLRLPALGSSACPPECQFPPFGRVSLYSSVQEGRLFPKVLLMSHLRRKNRLMRNLNCPKMSTFVMLGTKIVSERLSGRGSKAGEFQRGFAPGAKRGHAMPILCIPPDKIGISSPRNPRVRRGITT